MAPGSSREGPVQTEAYFGSRNPFTPFRLPISATSFLFALLFAIRAAKTFTALDISSVAVGNNARANYGCSRYHDGNALVRSKQASLPAPPYRLVLTQQETPLVA